MGDYVHLFANETERTQYEHSAQYNEPYISATDNTFDAEYNKRQDKHYGVKYTDLENNMHDFTYVEYDAEIEYLESTGTQYIDTGVNYDFTGTVKIIAKVIPINQNRSIIISNYCDGNAAALSAELGGTSNSHALQPRFYMSLTKAAITKDTWRPAFTLNTSNEMILEYDKSNGKKIFTTQGSSTTETFTGNKYGTPRNFILFLDHRSDTSAIAYGVRIQKTQIYINNQLVSDLIPVRVGNTGYMYDKISCQLLGNSGSGNFILGPDKYDAQIQYLESTGTQYIDLNYYAKGTDIVEIRVKSTVNDFVYNAPQTDYYLWNPFFGMQDSANYKFWGTYVGVKKSNNVFLYFYNQSAGTNAFPGFSPALTNAQVLNWYTYKFNQKTLYRDGSKMTGTNNGTVNDTILNKLTIYLFGVNDKAVRPTSKLQIAWFKLSDKNNVLKFDMIPVRVGQVGYMYDRVSGQLFGNAGSGQFVLGPDV